MRTHVYLEVFKRRRKKASESKEEEKSPHHYNFKRKFFQRCVCVCVTRNEDNKSVFLQIIRINEKLIIICNGCIHVHMHIYIVNVSVNGTCCVYSILPMYTYSTHLYIVLFLHTCLLV